MKFLWVEADTQEELEAVQAMLNQVSGSKTAKTRSEINHQNYERRKAKSENGLNESEIQTKESTKENIYILNNPEDINNSLEELNTLEDLSIIPEELSINTSEELKEKEIKKEKEKKKAERRERREERKYGKKAYGQFRNVFLTDEELDKFQKQFPDWERRIEEMSMGIASKGYSYKSHYAALLNWARKNIPVIYNQQPLTVQPTEESWMEVAERIQRERDAQKAVVEL